MNTTPPTTQWPRTIAKHWEAFWFAPRPAHNLAYGRLIFFGLLFLLYLPREMALTIQVFAPYELSPNTMVLLKGLEILWTGSLLCASLGLWTRFSMWMSALIGFGLLGWQSHIGPFHHQDSLTALALIIFASSKAGDAVTLSPTRPAHAPGPSAEYHWPLQLICALFLFMFFAAGVAKLRFTGWAWWNTDLSNLALANQYFGFLQGERQNPSPGWIWLRENPRLNPWLTSLTLLMELSAPLALFCKPLKWPLLGLLGSLQLGIALTFGWTFYSSLAFYPLFFLQSSQTPKSALAESGLPAESPRRI